MFSVSSSKRSAAGGKTYGRIQETRDGAASVTEPTTTPTGTPTTTPTSGPNTGTYGGEWVAGSTVAVNGTSYSNAGGCYEAQNNPGTWDTPTTTGWFWAASTACP